MKEETVQKLKDYAHNFLSYRPRSVYETEINLIKFCKKHNYDIKLVGQVVESLRANGYLDDLKFARWWIDQRMEFRPKGKFLISRELNLKGISKEDIEKAMGLISGKNEEETALKAAGKKMASILRHPREARIRKLSQFLLRRGFGWDTVDKVSKNMLKGNPG